MKKLLILFVAAAIIGVVISKDRGQDAESPQQTVAVTAEDADPAPPRQPGPPARPDAGVVVAQAPAPPVALATPVGEEPIPTEHAAEAPEPEPLALSATVPAPGAPTPDPSGPERQVTLALDEAMAALEKGERVKARAILTELYLASRGEAAQMLRDLLDRINADLVFSPRCFEGAIVHVVEKGEVLARINCVQPERIRVGQKLKVITGRTSIVAFRDEFRMALLMDGAFIKEFPIGIGKNDKTPVGSFVVESMLVRPRWYPPEGGIIEYGQEGHLLGERWIGFQNEPGAEGLGIHGTNDDSSIGTKCSNGCLRMHNPDVIELYDFVQIGTHVEIRE